MKMFPSQISFPALPLLVAACLLIGAKTAFAEEVTVQTECWKGISATKDSPLPGNTKCVTLYRLKQPPAGCAKIIALDYDCGGTGKVRQAWWFKEPRSFEPVLIKVADAPCGRPIYSLVLLFEKPDTKGAPLKLASASWVK